MLNGINGQGFLWQAYYISKDQSQTIILGDFLSDSYFFWCCKLCLGSYRKYLSLWDLPTELPGVSNKEVIISEHCPVP